MFRPYLANSIGLLSALAFSFSEPATQAAEPSNKDIPAALPHVAPYMRMADVKELQGALPDLLFGQIKLEKYLVDSPQGIIIGIYGMHPPREKHPKYSAFEQKIAETEQLVQLVVDKLLQLLPDELVAFHPEAITNAEILISEIKQADELKKLETILAYEKSILSALKIESIPEAVENTQAVRKQREVEKKLEQKLEQAILRVQTEIIKSETGLIRDIGGIFRAVLHRDIPIRITSDSSLSQQTLELIDQNKDLKSAEMIENVRQRDKRTVELLSSDLPVRPYKIVTLGSSHDLLTEVQEWNVVNKDKQWSCVSIRIDPAVLDKIIDSYASEATTK